ncbi:MAG: hypothetical protein KDD52_08375 [Bdellovibrionales bacterium]|nr:hypothetical protein [Bdellovibrionales bacterium]
MAIKLGSLSNEDLSSWSDEGELPRALETIKAETKTLSERLPFETLTTNEKSYDEISTVRLQSSIKSLVGIIGPFIRTAEPVICSKEATVGSIHQAVTDQIEANEIAQKVGKEKGYQNLLGDYFQGIQTELEPVLEMVQWLKTIHSLKLPVPFMQALIQDSHGVIGTFHNFSDKWKKDLQAIEESFHLLSEFGEMKSEFFDGRSFHDVSMGSIQKRVNVALGSMNNILRWADYCRLVQQGENNGLAMLMESLATGDLPSEQAEDMFLFTVYDSIAQRLVQEHEVLSTFTRHRHEERRKKFVQLDKRILELSRERIAYHASRTRPPMGIGRGPIRTWTESALLDREINKTMRHIPIRRLLERAGKAIKALKPCFMMSPMSVAQFLEPGEHEFDVVIMDEASQLKPHEALGAVARAKQAIIVGDPKQLPPTTFFDAMADNLEEQEEETSIDDTESILDSCMTVKFPTTRLKWHYRSEHESLIAFSNSEWYDNDLIIFPSPDDSQTDLGIQFHYIEDAKYASQKNLKEAEYVAQAIIDHGKRNSGLSLGVGTFNLQQKNLIEDLVEKLRKEGPANDTAVENLLANETEPLFIKNLENLQGDERDVIYISCTYGPDVETGKIYQRFGPINGRNGSRRLNVMFTRAKKRMEIFSSMQPEDVIGGPKSSLGANALKRFLRYASSGQITEAGEITNREPDSDFEIAVAKVLKQHGYEIKPQVGVAGFFIDIGICHPDREGEFIVGIECDGAAYHSARSARDRDRLREEVLLRRGWRIYRIWSTDWFKNRDVEIDRLLKTLAKYREEDSHVVRTKEKAAITVPKEHKIERQSGQELRARLLEYRRENITPRETSPSDGVLRNDLLLALVEMRPTSLDEFQERIPSQLRENIYSDERQFLDDIFSIIETSIDG